MKIIKNLKNKWIILSVYSFVLIFDLIFLYYFKYSSLGVSITLLNISLIGNFLNLFFSSLLIIGLIILWFQKEKSITHKTIINFLIGLNVLLISGAVSKFFSFGESSIYILEQPLHKIITGILFSSYELLIFIFIFYIWFKIFNQRNQMLVKIYLASIILFIILFVFSFFYIRNESESESNLIKDASLNNVAVVLGSAVWSDNRPSPSLSSRVDRAIDLYRKKIVGKIQLTGSNAPGELSEAEVAYRRLIFQNVDTSDIWVEKRTSSTVEQIQFIKNNLEYDKDINKLYIISDSYHLTRVKEICKFFNVNAKEVDSLLNLSFQTKLYYKIRESVALLIFWLFAL